MSEQYLFPHRREFLRTTTAAAAAVILPPVIDRGLTVAARDKPPVRIGDGPWTYTLDESWGTLPAGMKYGFGCALVVDSRDRIFVTSRSTNPCVAIFDRDGKLLETWANEFTDKIGFDTKQYADTVHGLYWSKEPAGEFFYWTENKSTNRTGT